MTKPTILNVHPNPRLVELRRLLSKIGHTTPPVDDPAIVIPIANALFFLKNFEIVASAGHSTNENPSPISNACAKKNCQYSLHNEVMKTPRRRRMEPKMRGMVGPILSTRRPAGKAPVKRMKVLKDPIQEMSKGVLEDSWCKT